MSKVYGPDPPGSDGSQRPGGLRGQQLGNWGEQLAADRMVVDGYCILARNFRCRYGEIDIIAEHEGDLVFIEVKTRRGIAYGLPEEAITPLKVRRMLRAIHYYLSIHEELYSERSWRIDVVAVQLNSTGSLKEIRIYPHAIAF
jgi:Predicted endonuclease distantly related to archaeal Holliday junction resolvase